MLFGLLILLVIGGGCLAEIWAEIVCYRRELRSSSQANVFVCGDSRTEHGLNPALWPELFNFSARGRPLDQTCLTAKDILDANPGQFKTMLVDVSAERASDDYALPVGKMFQGDEYTLLYLLHLDAPLRNLSGIFLVMRDLMVDRLHFLSRVIRGRRRFASSLVSGYQKAEGCLKLKSAMKFARHVDNIHSRSKVALDSPSSRTGFFRHLGKLIESVRGRGVAVVLLTAPWHTDLIDRAGRNRLRSFCAEISAYAKRQGCRYLDFSEMAIPDSHWMDCNHLNSRGAALFTSAVKKALEGDDRP